MIHHLRGAARGLIQSKSERIYAYPHLGGLDLGFARIPGAGLGNLLLPWARAIVAARRHHWTPLFPTWPQLKLGSLLRRDRDLRLYAGMFQCPATYVGSPGRLLLLLRGPRVAETVAPESVSPGTVVIFRGLTGAFEPIRDEHELVRRELFTMARPEQRHHWDPGGSVSIGVHVRMGDFQPVPPAHVLESGPAGYGHRLPLDWYIAMVDQLRRALGPVPVRVFSDGTNHELGPLLRHPGVEREDRGSPLGDLLALASARVLIGSASTFSMWASYLGRMPTVWYRSQQPPTLFPDRPGAEAAVALGESLPQAFLQHAQAAITSRPIEAKDGP